jgi:hypothetical protein
MKLPCPYCGDSIKYEESLGGKTIVCGYCKRSLLMPFVAQLPPDSQEEFRQEQYELRKKAKAEEQKRLRDQGQESERKRAALLRQQELEKQAEERRLQRAAEAEETRLRQEARVAKKQEYLQAIADAKAAPEKPKIWHCLIKGSQHGPMQESMVQKWADDGILGEDDHVRVEGSATWIRVPDIPERFHIPVHAAPGAVAVVKAPKPRSGLFYLVVFQLCVVVAVVVSLVIVYSAPDELERRNARSAEEGFKEGQRAEEIRREEDAKKHADWDRSHGLPYK